MTPSTSAEQAPRIDAGPLSLSFTWDGERWRHALACNGLLVADSDEGDDRPVYQQIHLQDDGDDPVALLVGQSAHRHYSASFRATSSGGEYRLEIDIAARRLAGNQPLVCAYRVPDGATTPTADAAGIAWPAPAPGRLRLAPDPPSLAIDINPLGVTLTAHSANKRQSETTVQRAFYHWSWSSNSPEDL